MNQLFEDNSYIIIDNFISLDRAQELYNFFLKEVQEYPHLFHGDDQCEIAFGIYNYRPFVKLLCEKVPFMTELLGEPMLPTYSYARIYVNGVALKKHTDRKSCEISVTLHLGGDHPWKIYMTKPNGEVVGIDLKPGQAIIYKGLVSEHWRDPFKGNYYGQVFLHYVKADGENWECYGDRDNR